MNLKKLLVTGLIFSSVIMSNVFAEDADHSRLLPDFTKKFDSANLYFGLEVPFALPVGFTGDEKIAGIGAGVALEAGYDWDGWLAGIHTEFRHNIDNGNFMKSLNNTFISVEVSKLLGSSIIPFMPDFLDLRATAGFGLDLVNSVYYPNEEFKKNNVTIKGSGASTVTNFGIGLEYNKLDKIIPYVGFDIDLTGDKSGAFVHSSVNIGARTTLRRIKGPELEGNPQASIKPNSDFFTPDGDGNADTLSFKINTKYQKDAQPKDWKVEIIREFGERSIVIKTYSGEGRPPKSLVWNGESDIEKFRHSSAAEYKVVLTVEDSLENVNTVETTANIGILVEKLEDGSLRILVNSIKFDANKASFDTLSQRDKRLNEFTVKMVARALQKYKQYNVIVEGHAHNISGTEEEETEELIPLSKERADAIMKILIEEGIDEARLSSVGKGGKEPISTEPAQNRRVEFKLVSN